MKDRIFKLGLAVGLGVLMIALLGSLPVPVTAQGPLETGFTFQGRLRLDGQGYVTNVCDFSFVLFDSPGSGFPLASAAVDNVTVSDGYFSADLDFGPLFDGEARYLEIGVACPAGSGAYTILGERARLDPLPYAHYAPNFGSASVDWAAVTGKPAPDFTDNVDNVLTYTNGYGLDLAANQFSVIPATIINDSNLQRRILDSCNGTDTIRAINADGSVECRGGGVDYTVGEGLKFNAVNPLVIETDLDIVQQRVSSLECDVPGGGQAIRRVLPTGAVECELIPGGDITAIVNQGGLLVDDPADPGVVTVTVATGGITTTMLASGTVTTGDLGDSAVNTAALGNDAITTTNIVNGSLKREDLHPNGCVDGEKLMWVNNNWGCGIDASANLVAGSGITITGQTISALTTNGVKISAGAIVPDFASPGSPDAVARSNHDHAGVYVQFDTNPAGGDLSGNYGPAAGFTVQGILGYPISGSPSNNSTLLYKTSPQNQWTFTTYNFDPVITPVEATGQGSSLAQCPSGTKVIGGGCECGEDCNIFGCNVIDTEAEYPDETGNAWRCRCNDDNIDSKATAYCLNTVYK